MKLSVVEIVVLWAAFTFANGVAKAFNKAIREADETRKGLRASCDLCNFNTSSNDKSVVTTIMTGHYKDCHDGKIWVP